MKKIKKLLSVLLCFIISFCSFLPVNAYAKSGIIEYNLLRVLAMNRDGTILLDKQGSLSDVRSIIGDFNQTEVQTIQIDYGIDGTLAAGDTLTANIAFIVSRYKSFGGFMVRLLMQGGRSYILSDAIVDYDYSSSTLTVSNMVMPVDVPENSFISIGMGNPTYNADYSSVVFGFGIKSYDMNSQSEQTGFFNNIIQWLKDIVDKIKGLPDAIGNFINSLGDKISGFFTNLTNNLKTWFNNIGKWFTDLGNNIKTLFTNITNSLKGWFADVGNWFVEIGNKIGTFFDNIWENISDSVSNITQSIKDWWASVIEFFKNLVVPQEGFFTEYLERINKWFEEHLGFIYQSAQLIVELTQRLVDVTNSVGDPVVVIPEMRLPYNNVVIVPYTTFDFNSIINADSKIKWVYNTYRTVVTAIMIYYLVMFGYNKLNEIIKDRKDNEG